MKTLVTGATGFIGKSLLHQNIEGDIHTLSRSHYFSSKKDTYQHYGNLHDLDFIKNLAKLKFERVIHLAWQGLPSLEPENNRSNFNISRDFIKILIDSGVQEVNVSGSCLEYGDLENLVDENTAGRNISDFGQTKLELLDYLATQEVPYRWFRIFYAYGPFQHKNSLLMEAYRSAKLGSPFFPNEPGVCKDFIFVDDVARAISRLLQTKDAFGVFNVGSGNSTSIGALVNTLNQEMRIPIQHFNPNPDGLKANCKKIEEACGWIPSIEISQGVNKFFQWANTYEV